MEMKEETITSSCREGATGRNQQEHIRLGVREDHPQQNGDLRTLRNSVRSPIVSAPHLQGPHPYKKEQLQHPMAAAPGLEPPSDRGVLLNHHPATPQQQRRSFSHSKKQATGYQAQVG
ncbi:hypothetical protein PIB30_090644 [Stylosanthes scabra]|uniref:Uncharacterized protein n=1 Tax=Stylosanthes scabra TaxID=79078 RepID=A0ABU6WSQ4_9FABA|nr:hypothetical protein [Stylosanthes scabra]